MFIRIILLVFLSSGAADPGHTIVLNKANLRSNPCDESFPLARPTHRAEGTSDYDGRRRERRLVPIPPGDDSGEYYETGEYYAPLCPDGLHIDVHKRQLRKCTGGACFDNDISVREYYIIFTAFCPSHFFTVLFLLITSIICL